MLFKVEVILLVGIVNLQFDFMKQGFHLFKFQWIAIILLTHFILLYYPLNIFIKSSIRWLAD